MMGHVSAIPSSEVGRMLAGFSRDQLASIAEAAIDLLDLVDGDPDEESDPLNEGEPAFAVSDRAYVNRWGAPGPGCVIGDPDSAVDDNGCDDVNDDREEEYHQRPVYGVDQTKGILWHERF